jgi:two-component system LytT family response regulator
MEGRTENSLPFCRAQTAAFMKLQAIIVDDEPAACERIRLFLREEPDVQLVAECSSGSEALAQIKKYKPNLVFLDVRMPGMNGFELLQNIPPQVLPAVIFTTAYDQHAVRAFEAHALDYLLKPFKAQRFKKAVQRVRDHFADNTLAGATHELLRMLAEKSQASPNENARLTVKTHEKVVVLDVKEIDSIESAGNYIAVHVGKDSYVVRDTLTSLEGRLPANQFMRISRAAIVNLNRIKEMHYVYRGESVVILKTGRTVLTTRNLREIQNKLEEI